MKGSKLKLLLVAIAIIAAWLLFGGRGYKATIKQYVKAEMGGDAKKLVSLMPESYVNMAIQSGMYTNKKEAIADLQSTLDSLTAIYDDYLGEKWKYTYEITGISRYGKAERESLNFEYYGLSSSQVKGFMDVALNITASGVVEEYTSEEGLQLIKIGRKWYLASMY